jgi:hypothetical protein
MGERVANCSKRRVGRRRQPIVDPHPFAPGRHEACAPQIRQMARRLRLWHTQAVVNVADAHFPAQQQTQDPQASRVGERLEQAFEVGQ